MIEDSNPEKNTKYLIYVLITLSIIFIILSFVAPWLFTSYSIIDLTNKDNASIGDTLGGIMNPFIAISGVILTFIAFYIQYKANQYQRIQFNIQLEKEKEQFKIQLDLQRDQFLKSQFENQFYQMLSIHRANINDLRTMKTEFEIDTFELTKMDRSEIAGIKALKYLLNELELCLKLAKKHFPDVTVTKMVNEAYGLFWNGVSKKEENKHSFFIEALKIKENFGNSIFLGKSNQLAHYYRQLFQTVKFIVNQSIYTYEEKRNFIRILRSQLPNEEQVLLFYNWYSGFGHQWEDGKNKFFTDYRMIHNIFPNMITIENIDLKKLFDTSNLLIEKNRLNDSLFEYEDRE